MNDHACVVGLSVCVLLSSPVLRVQAQDTGGEMFVEQVSSVIDREARKLGGIKTVTEHFKKQFGVANDVIYALREAKISYGEINAVLAMAEQMPGGINEDNLDEILDMRAGAYDGGGWEQVAGYLGIDRRAFFKRINTVASQIPAVVHNDARQVSVR